MNYNYAKFCSLTKRHNKVYFKDKATFLMSLISPLILLFLFITFLRNVYVSSFMAGIPEGFVIPDKTVNGFVGGWLISSILAVSSVTIAFCSNIVMVNDKTNGCFADFNSAPVKKSTIRISYFVSNFITTFIVCLIALVIGFIYIAISGWFLSVMDVILIFAVLILNILFGTLLSSIIMSFISSQGGVSAIATCVSAMYGFICGAYMPLSQFNEGIKSLIAFMPGVYPTILLRQLFMGGAVDSLNGLLPAEAINGIKDGFDLTFSPFGQSMSSGIMYLIIGLTILVLFGIFLSLVYVKKKRHKIKLLKEAK